MNVQTLASSLRTRWIILAAGSLLAACTPPNNGGDTGNNNNDATIDIQYNYDAQDAPVDRRGQLRDVGQEANLDSAYTQCFVSVSPRTGTTSDTFVITGTGILNATMALLTVTPEAGGTPVVNMNVPLTGGMFTYNLPGAGLAVGNYRVDIVDPSYTCSAFGPFTVN